MNSYEIAQEKIAQEKSKAAVITSGGYDELSPKFDASVGYHGHSHIQNLDGDKWAGSFGATILYEEDYWTLRARSDQLFNDNLYARGLIRRLVTNEINTGLTPEASPDEVTIGLPRDSTLDWTEIVESRFAVWGKTPELCDSIGENTFGHIQRTARREALVSGDVLCVQRLSARTGSIVVTLIRGDKVRTPLEHKIKKGHKIQEGVELDAQGRQVAYWVKQKGGDFKRIPARGEKSGRRLAWLIYGTDRRLGKVRGQPLLSLILQSIKELDRYRDSVQRKATVNSLLAMFIKKTQDKAGTLPITGGAVRKDTIEVEDGDGSTRTRNIASQVPGVVIEELQVGEEPIGFSSQGTDTSFPEFEAAIINAIAWANEIPPEILTLAFTNNYSASQAAINEFKIYLNLIWSHFGDTFCAPIYREWLINETLQRKVDTPGFLEAWRDRSKQDIAGAWVLADWYGSIKPSTDMVKAAKASKALIDMGLTTHAREARINTGTKFSKNVQRLRRENEQLAEAKRPIAEFMEEFSTQKASLDSSNAIEGIFEEYLEASNE